MGQSQRVRRLSGDGTTERGSGPIGYWMHASVRTRCNHALEYAVHLAAARERSLVVFFVITPDYPGARTRHYRFLVDGIIDAARALEDRNIAFHLFVGDPPDVIGQIAACCSELVIDRGYTRVHTKWYASLLERSSVPIVQVESNIVVPVETASEKEEYSAATIRRKIHREWESYLVPITSVLYTGKRLETFSVRGVRTLPINRTTTAQEIVSELATGDSDLSDAPVGGQSEAIRRLDTFLESKLDRYHDLRNVPDLDWTSGLSAYLHFGHISPVEIALAAIDYREREASPPVREGTDAFLEELIVRRELAINFVHYNDRYDRYSSLPEWARTTLDDHRTDDRAYVYSREQLESAETHDPYWNAAQREMVLRGSMHGYMRMYWGKKILEWVQEPEEAYAIALELNDRYELDGRDPNGYAGVAWCFGKHDRPWTERPVFGKVRYMNDNGLRRKFKNIDEYVKRWTDRAG